MVEAKLPPGFRFHPRDEELICDYLMKKVTSSHGCPLMIEVDLNKCEPWDIPVTITIAYNVDDELSSVVVATVTAIAYHVDDELSSVVVDIREDWVLCRVFCKNRQVAAKQGMTRSSYDDTSSSSLLLPLMDSYISFNQTQSTSIPNECEQVPCFSISTIPNQNQTNPTFSHGNIINQFVDQKVLLFPTKTPVTTPKLTFDASAAMVPDLGARMSSFSCENKVLKAVLNHLTEMEIRNPSIEGTPSFGEGSSESFLSDLGFPTFWNHY
ncbi:hypothetical protein U1Q18_000156 [Sarracenia purpurea var. burkii]